MTNSVLEAIERIGPQIAARSNEIERERGLPIDVVEMIKPTGAFRMYVPEDLNGPAVDAQYLKAFPAPLKPMAG